MPYSTRVRPARPDDLDHIVRLFRDNLSQLVPGQVDLSEYGSALINEFVRRHAFSKDAGAAVHTYVIEEVNSENILGYASIKDQEVPIPGIECSRELIDIVIPLWNEGFGSMMMSYLKQHYQDQGLWIRVRKRSGKRKFWLKLDFQLVGETPYPISTGNGDLSQPTDETTLIMLWQWSEDQLQ